MSCKCNDLSAKPQYSIAIIPGGFGIFLHAAPRLFAGPYKTRAAAHAAIETLMFGYGEKGHPASRPACCPCPGCNSPECAS